MPAVRRGAVLRGSVFSCVRTTLSNAWQVATCLNLEPGSQMPRDGLGVRCVAPEGVGSRAGPAGSADPFHHRRQAGLRVGRRRRRVARRVVGAGGEGDGPSFRRWKKPSVGRRAPPPDARASSEAWPPGQQPLPLVPARGGVAPGPVARATSSSGR
jgi:hypothetical protein